MTFIVVNKTGQHWLKSTIWTSAKDTATRYATAEDARAALQKAAKFNPAAAKRATIVRGGGE